ncbi:ketopantoate reductase family protein [Nitratiruptor sp. YY09-18]|uniref:ketopantoate reductase family protein n=1 Tax=Nitratiruptor sp. YY09-18 TaxID=2724901 RepID=UPI001916395B|nr:2-dehydropantoate 2-reductase [Nitratiruptor sp. YY09-18]BCD68462.1 2-dehydropantoate 2-reductase [Nitratiruptor sp. YY09-18]
MNIAVVGGGGVGAYIAAKLSQVCDVDLISDSTKEIVIKEQGEVKRYSLPIFSHPPKNRHYDLVIVATKSNVLKEKLQKIAKNIDKNSIVLPLLNGIQPYYTLKQLTDARVIHGAIYIISNRQKDSTIEVKGKGAMVVFEDINETTQKLKRYFEKAGIKSKTPPNITKAIWQKYLFIAATAALTTYYNKTFGQIAAEHLDEFAKLLQDIVAIANKKGVNLDQTDVEHAMKLLQKSPAHAKTSMQLDFEQGKESELDNLIGFLASESEKFAKIYNELDARRASV